MGKNQFIADIPKLLSEWNWEKNTPLGLDPNTLRISSNKKVWWKCAKGHEWKAYINNRTLHNSGCPICSGRTILSGYNDLATVNPILASEWNYQKNDLDPALGLALSQTP